MTNMIIAAFKKNYVGGGNDSGQMMMTKKCAGPGRARAGDGTGINSSLLTSASHVNTCEHPCEPTAEGETLKSRNKKKDMNGLLAAFQL